MLGCFSLVIWSNIFAFISGISWGIINFVSEDSIMSLVRSTVTLGLLGNLWNTNLNNSSWNNKLVLEGTELSILRVGASHGISSDPFICKCTCMVKVIIKYSFLLLCHSFGITIVIICRT